MKRKIFPYVLCLVLLAGSIVILQASSPAEENKTDVRHEDEFERAEKAAMTFQEILGAPDHSIPEALLERAYGIAVIPNMVKGAFGVGGRFGKGLAAARDAQGNWGTPLFVEIGGGSFGLQLGVESTDLILVFVEKKGFEAMLKDKLKLGVNASVSAGPVGRTAEAGVNATLDSAIYSYSRSKGVFAGVAIDGAVLSADDSANKRVYGKKLKGRQIAIENQVEPAAEVLPFLNALKSSTPAHASH